MGWPLVFIGLILSIVGVRGKVKEFNEVLSDDLTGDPAFLPWLTAILIIAAFGSIKELKGFSDGFLALVVIVLILSNEGFIDKFFREIGVN